jgi:hypothetical protein
VSKKPLPKAGQLVDHRADLLSQRAASKTELPCKTEKQSLNCNQTKTVEAAGGTLNLPQRKGAGQRAKLSTKISVNKHRKGSKGLQWVGNKPLPEAGQVVDHRNDLLS